MSRVNERGEAEDKVVFLMAATRVKKKVARFTARNIPEMCQDPCHLLLQPRIGDSPSTVVLGYSASSTHGEYYSGNTVVK